ncbi:MAG: sialate O-acetylesterase [Verrucomicrobiales bacterium]|nr:sialate O-acetylesterase [Verrucomicrobiales bacterium]
MAVCLTASADVRLPQIFGDNMILQQKTSNAVWGFAEPGEKVTVKSSWGSEVRAVADKIGHWKILLKTPGHGTGYRLTVQGKNTLTVRNVAIGEVWLCAGQSNMGWRLSAVFGGAKDAALANYPNLRIFRSERKHSHQPQEDCVAKWAPCAPDSAATCSAVSFYFARKLHQELKIPVGIVVQAYAGTPIEGWMPREIQMNDPRTRKDVEETDKISAAYDITQAKKQLERAMQRWKQGERRGKPVLRTPGNWGHQYPGNIFNGMIHPVRPYGIRGAIWYQGERNAKDVPQALNYRRQLTLLINYYRSSWHELSGGNVAKDFAFYFTQLPSWTPAQEKPVEHLEAAWAINREMMRLVASEVPNTGMAVSIDTGDVIALHPKNKKPIGLRHAYLALKQVYGKDIVDNGPIFKKQTIKGNQISLEFDAVGSGLMTARPGKMNSFAIAGKDRKWHWADAKIKEDAVVVSSPEVSTPVAVRYAWAMNPSQRNLLYNKEGLPASPFRTDSWSIFDAKKDQAVIVNKPQKPEGYQPQDWARPKMVQ